MSHSPPYSDTSDSMSDSLNADEIRIEWLKEEENANAQGVETTQSSEANQKDPATSIPQLAQLKQLRLRCLKHLCQYEWSDCVQILNEMIAIVSNQMELPTEERIISDRHTLDALVFYLYYQLSIVELYEIEQHGKEEEDEVKPDSDSSSSSSTSSHPSDPVSSYRSLLQTLRLCLSHFDEESSEQYDPAEAEQEARGALTTRERQLLEVLSTRGESKRAKRVRRMMLEEKIKLPQPAAIDSYSSNSTTSPLNPIRSILINSHILHRLQFPSTTTTAWTISPEELVTGGLTQSELYVPILLRRFYVVTKLVTMSQIEEANNKAATADSTSTNNSTSSASSLTAPKTSPSTNPTSLWTPLLSQLLASSLSLVALVHDTSPEREIQLDDLESQLLAGVVPRVRTRFEIVCQEHSTCVLPKCVDVRTRQIDMLKYAGTKEFEQAVAIAASASANTNAKNTDDKADSSASSSSSSSPPAPPVSSSFGRAYDYYDRALSLSLELFQLLDHDTTTTATATASAAAAATETNPSPMWFELAAAGVAPTSNTPSTTTPSTSTPPSPSSLLVYGLPVATWLRPSALWTQVQLFANTAMAALKWMEWREKEEEESGVNAGVNENTSTDVLPPSSPSCLSSPSASASLSSSSLSSSSASANSLLNSDVHTIALRAKSLCERGLDAIERLQRMCQKIQRYVETMKTKNSSTNGQDGTDFDAAAADDDVFLRISSLQPNLLLSSLPSPSSFASLQSKLYFRHGLACYSLDSARLDCLAEASWKLAEEVQPNPNGKKEIQKRKGMRERQKEKERKNQTQQQHQQQQ